MYFFSKKTFILLVVHESLEETRVRIDARRAKKELRFAADRQTTQALVPVFHLNCQLGEGTINRNQKRINKRDQAAV